MLFGHNHLFGAKLEDVDVIEEYMLIELLIAELYSSILLTFKENL